MTTDEVTPAALKALRAQVQAQARVIAVLQDGLSTALSALAQATVPLDGFDEPVHYGPHSRTHLMGLSIALSRPAPIAEHAIEQAARKYAGLPATTGEAGLEVA